jgi:hypothetical protein
MKSKNYCVGLFPTAFLVFLLTVVSASAQTTAFTYQGRLTDGAAAANGTYEMQFRLFDMASGGTQIGSTITNSAVSVSNGVFTVTLDFTSSPFAAGTNRWLDIGVRKATDPPGFTILSPRRPITSSPYSLRTLSASSADGLSGACVGCVADAQINSVSGGKITGTVANAASAASAGNVTGTVAVANGGTGSNNASGARTNLGLGTLATVTPTGTANATTFLRGDNSWAAINAGAGAPIFATRSTNLTLNSGTYVNIISINLEANKTYFVEATVLGQRVGATNGTGRFDLVYSGNATTDFGLFFNGFLNDTVIDSTPSYDTDASPTTYGSTVSERLSVRGYLRTTSAGTLTIRGARSSINTTVDLNIREGSFLTARSLN